MNTISDTEFTEVYNNHKRALFGTIYKVLKDHHETESVLHEVFRKLLNQDYEDIKPHLRQWLFTVAKNQAIKAYHKRNRFIPLNEELDSERVDESIPVDQEMMNSELISQIPNLMKVLTKNQKKAIQYRYFKDFSYKQIGKTLKLKESNVGFILHKAIHNLRAEFLKLNKKFGYV